MGSTHLLALAASMAALSARPPKVRPPKQIRKRSQKGRKPGFKARRKSK